MSSVSEEFSTPSTEEIPPLGGSFSDLELTDSDVRNQINISSFTPSLNSFEDLNLDEVKSEITARERAQLVVDCMSHDLMSLPSLNSEFATIHSWRKVFSYLFSNQTLSKTFIDSTSNVVDIDTRYFSNQCRIQFMNRLRCTSKLNRVAISSFSDLYDYIYDPKKNNQYQMVTYYFEDYREIQSISSPLRIGAEMSRLKLSYKEFYSFMKSIDILSLFSLEMKYPNFILKQKFYLVLNEAFSRYQNGEEVTLTDLTTNLNTHVWESASKRVINTRYRCLQPQVKYNPRCVSVGPNVDSLELFFKKGLSLISEGLGENELRDIRTFISCKVLIGDVVIFVKNSGKDSIINNSSLLVELIRICDTTKQVTIASKEYEALTYGRISIGAQKAQVNSYAYVSPEFPFNLLSVGGKGYGTTPTKLFKSRLSKTYTIGHKIPHINYYIADSYFVMKAPWMEVTRS
ncbi:hypothetical protein CAAN3_01S00958 [[Candida] anglica]